MSMTSFVYEIFIKSTHLFVGNCLFIPFHLHSALKRAAAPPGRSFFWKHWGLNITSCLSRALGGGLLSEGCIRSIVPVGLGGSSHAETSLTAPEHPPRPPHPRRPWSRARRCPGCPRGFGWRSPCTRTLRTPSFVQTCQPCHFIFPFSVLIWCFHVPMKLPSILCPTRQRGRGVTPVTSTCTLQSLHKPSPRTYTLLRLVQDQALRVSPG